MPISRRILQEGRKSSINFENFSQCSQIFFFTFYSSKPKFEKISSSWETIIGTWRKSESPHPDNHGQWHGHRTAGVIQPTVSFFFLLSAGPFPYDIRFDFLFISVCLTVRPRNKEDGRRGRGWRARVLLCLLSSSSGLITQSLPPFHPSTVFRPSITFHSSAWCSLLRLITGYLGEIKRKTERGRKGREEEEEGGEGWRGERRSHDLCVNGELARERSMIENIAFFQREIDCLREGGLKNWWKGKEFVVEFFFFVII